eukprot:9497730-Pyramimonas_sp.AAC.1
MPLARPELCRAHRRGGRDRRRRESRMGVTGGRDRNAASLSWRAQHGGGSIPARSTSPVAGGQLALRLVASSALRLRIQAGTSPG